MNYYFFALKLRGFRPNDFLCLLRLFQIIATKQQMNERMKELRKITNQCQDEHNWSKKKNISSTFDCLAISSSVRNEVMSNECFTFKTVNFDSPIRGREKWFSQLQEVLLNRLTKNQIFLISTTRLILFSFILYMRHLEEVSRFVFLTGEYSVKPKLWKVSTCFEKKKK